MTTEAPCLSLQVHSHAAALISTWSTGVQQIIAKAVSAKSNVCGKLKRGTLNSCHTMTVCVTNLQGLTAVQSDYDAELMSGRAEGLSHKYGGQSRSSHLARPDTRIAVDLYAEWWTWLGHTSWSSSELGTDLPTEVYA